MEADAPGLNVKAEVLAPFCINSWIHMGLGDKQGSSCRMSTVEKDGKDPGSLHPKGPHKDKRPPVWDNEVKSQRRPRCHLVGTFREMITVEIRLSESL